MEACEIKKKSLTLVLSTVTLPLITDGSLSAHGVQSEKGTR
jgi:hypothetical protein